jgi:hypothetical protein
MPFNPEAIEVALFAKLKTAIIAATSGSTPFKVMSRHARIWGNITPDQQPAFFLAPLGGKVEQQVGWGAPRYELHYMALVYTRADANASPTNPVAPQTLLNQCWAAIQSTLLGTPPGEPQTLGIPGVINAWTEGEVTMQAAILDQQGALEVPIHVLCAI